MNREDLTGQRFGDLVVLGLGEPKRDPAGTIKECRWLCLCVCGNTTQVVPHHLKRGKTRSCGCHKRRKGRGRKHGESNPRTTEYNTWTHIKKRCYNPKEKFYYRYGGRGIFVCERWLESYEAFLEDMGRKPSPRHSLERRDNDGGYSPTNCYWATPKEQARNTHRTIKIAWNGEKRPLKEWAEVTGIAYCTLLKRHQLKWSPERMMTPLTRPYYGNQYDRIPPQPLPIGVT